SVERGLRPNASEISLPKPPNFPFGEDQLSSARSFVLTLRITIGRAVLHFGRATGYIVRCSKINAPPLVAYANQPDVTPIARTRTAVPPPGRGLASAAQSRSTPPCKLLRARSSSSMIWSVTAR